MSVPRFWRELDTRYNLIGSYCKITKTYHYPRRSFNPEAGSVWLQRAISQWKSHLWINPTPKKYWEYSQSTHIIKNIFSGKMVPLTIEGIEEGTKILSNKN